MKKQIRIGVFETNSSSTHSITMMMKTDYDRWENEKLYLYDDDYGFGYEFNKPEKGNLYTKDEVEAFIKGNKYYNGEEIDFDDYGLLRGEYGFVHPDYEDDYLESYYNEFTTKSGETVVAFGYYGHD